MSIEKTGATDLSDHDYVALIAAIWALEGYPVDDDAADRIWQKLKAQLATQTSESTDV